MTGEVFQAEEITDTRLWMVTENLKGGQWDWASWTNVRHSKSLIIILPNEFLLYEKEYMWNLNSGYC